MRKHLLGISAIALLSATSVAIAQDERGGSSGGGASPHPQQDRNPLAVRVDHPAALCAAAVKGMKPGASSQNEPSNKGGEMKGAEDRSGGALKEKSASDKSAKDKAPAEKSATDGRSNKNEKQAGDAQARGTRCTQQRRRPRQGFECQRCRLG